jgi:hypothetical protein
MCLELGSNCDSESTINCSAAALLQEGRYISLSGARYDCLPKFPDLLRNGIEKSRRYQEEGTKAALISTVLEVFVPTDPSTDDAFAIVPIGTTEIWHILQVLGIVG